MRLCALHEPAGGWAPIAPIDGGPPVAACVGGNPLAAGWTPPPAPPAPIGVLWSGSLAGDLEAAHPANWMPAGRAALDRVCGTLDRRRRWCVRPHARHVLSDVPSCRRFLEDHAGAGLGPHPGIALSPATMLEPSMIDTAEDHLVRLFEGLGAACALVFLEDVVVDEAAGACRAVPLGEGVLPVAALADLLARHVPSGVPIVLAPPRVVEQRLRLESRSTACP